MAAKTQKRTKIETETSTTQETSPEQSENIDRKIMIAEAAYYRAEQRGFSPDQENEDWLEAEKQIEEMLSAA